MGRGGPSSMDGIGGPPCGQGVGGSGVGKGPVGSLWVSVGSLRGPNVSQCIPVGPTAFLWGLCGSQWVFVGPNPFLWGLCGSQWVCVGPNGSVWVPMGLCGSQWVCVGPNGSVWVPVPFYGVCVCPNAFVWAFRARVAVSPCSPACRLLSPHTAGLGLNAHPRPFCASFPPRGKRWGSAVPIQPQ